MNFIVVFYKKFMITTTTEDKISQDRTRKCMTAFSDKLQIR